MTIMTCTQVCEMLIACADRIIRNESFLSQIDSKIGDGDHGIGMKKGMNAAKDYLLSADNENNINSLYANIAIKMQESMGGASGMIFSALFAGMASSSDPLQEITPQIFAEKMAKGLEAVQEIGHAKVGDKTMVDALAPAVEAMKNNVSSFETMFYAAEEAANIGVKKSKDYIARFGRAKNLMERAIGHQDAGATSIWLIILEMKDYVTGTKTPDPKVESYASTEIKEVEVKWKKKIINNPTDVVKEESEGFLEAFGAKYKAIPGVNGLIKREIPDGKTILLVGGGAGHEPMFSFFIGDNLADCSVSGNVFTSPDPMTILQTAEEANRGAGILFLYGNYAGDNMNFDKAAEELEKKGVPVRTIRVWDDIASAPKERIRDRRGIAGDVLLMKIAGAACAKLPLEEAYRVTAKARDNLYTIGVGLEGATIPGQKNPIFSLPPDEMEYGLGIHGEPGVKRLKMETADQICEHLFQAIMDDSGLHAGDTICTYINGLGSTTLMELMILNRKLAMLCKEKKLIVHDMDVNSLVITLEMAGASVSIMKMDEELLYYYNMPCNSPYYKK